MTGNGKIKTGIRGWETTVGEGSPASWEPMPVIPVFRKLRQEG